jgi:hypothetical protein
MSAQSIGRARPWPGRSLAVAVLSSAVIACSTSPGLTDAETAWCDTHVVAVMSAASGLGVLPYQLVGPVADVPGAPSPGSDELLVFRADRARAMAETDEARGTEPADYHTLGYLRAWKEQSPDTYRRACQSAFGTR